MKILLSTRLGGNADEIPEERHQRYGTGHRPELRVGGYMRVYVALVGRAEGARARHAFLLSLVLTVQHVVGGLHSIAPCS